MKVLFISILFSLQFCGLFGATKPRVVCYWPEWTGHKTMDIEPTLCTHIHYAFFVMDDVNNVIKDKSGKPQPELYKSLVALKQKNKDLKIIPSVGGWGEPDIKFSNMVNNPVLRKKFIENTLQLLKKYNFDGFDIDWEYPVCWSGKCEAGPKSDKENYGKLIKELREVFDKERPVLSLSAAVVSSEYIADKAYDYKSIVASLDYVNVMTYAMQPPVSDNKTGHHSKYNECIVSVEQWVKKGVPKDKVLMGVPFYGRSYTLANKSKHNQGAPITGVGKENSGYQTICDNVKHQGWIKEQADNGHDPIAYKGDQWIGYDDPYAVYAKSKWVKDNGYGGIIIWEITTDDYNKKCCSVTNPLLRAINNGLYGTGSGPETYGCEHK